MSTGYPAAVHAQDQSARFYGKYRGIVTDNDDPQSIGRIKARVPEVLADEESGWALPSLPCAGDNQGVYFIPSPGTAVWIEFEAGAVDRPIWTGCFWGSGQLPKNEKGAGAKPPLKILRSEQGMLVALDDDAKTITLSDSDGNNLITIKIQDGQIKLLATTKIIVESPAIELVEGASHPVVFGDDLLQYLNQIVTTFNAHLHPGELAAGIIPVTPAPPVAPMSPPTPSLLSIKVKTG